MPVQIAPVTGLADLREFVRLPFRLHTGTPWVPELKLERYQYLNRKLNAFFKHGEAQYFLARRDGRVVGRITAHIDQAYNAYHGTRDGNFGFVEFEDDPEILAGLLGAAREWLRARGCDRLLGPMDFTLNDGGGILFEGYEREPLIRQPWHPPYYAARCEEVGLTKAMDLLSWWLHMDNRTSTLNPILERLAERAREKHGVRIRSMSRAHLRQELDVFAAIYNSAWSQNWGFVPYSKTDLDAYALDLQLVYDRDWFLIAENDDGPIAMAITIPDINQVYQRMRGRLLPTGWYSYLTRRQIIDRVRVGFLGVLPEYQHTGAAAALYMAHFDAAARTRITHGEASWILEVNSSMNRGLEAMGGQVVKRWRVYEQPLTSPA